MRIVRRYLLIEFIRYFLIVLLTSTAIMMVAEFFDKADEFYSKGATFGIVAQYLLLLIPRFLVYSLPIASLLAVLITTGIASKWNETLIVRASGGSLKRLFLSFLVVGLLITLLGFFLNEVVVPASTRKASWIRNVKILKRSQRITYSERALWMRGLDGSLIRIGDFVEDKDSVLNVSIFNFDPGFRLIRRIEAKRAEWVGNGWVFRDVIVYELNEGTTQRFRRLFSTTIEEPRIFREEMRRPEEMSFAELYRYYSRLEKAGFRNTKYVIRLYEKLTYPIINFIMVLFGLSLALNTGRGGGIWSAGIGVLVIVLFWFVYTLSISLGNTGVIPPWSAPWIAPLLFGVAGSLLFVKIRG
jgi:lipopolysaccharide export system permease protein